jgi:hypothetical protein
VASERIDPELLAAFLDGGLSGDEADRVRAQLAQSDESYQLMLESAALLRDLEHSEQVTAEPAMAPPANLPIAARAVPSAPSVPARARRSARYVWTIGSLLAAAGIGAVLITRSPSGEIPAPVSTVATGVAPLSPGWNDPGWSTVRGGGSSLSAEAAAFRVGARFVELEAAFSARDTAAVAAARATLVALLDGIDGGPLVVPSITGLTADDLTTDRTRQQTVDQLRALGPDPVWFDVGAWCEAARLAPGSIDVLAQPASSRAALDAIIQRSERLATPSRQAMQQVLAPLRAVVEMNVRDRATVSRLVDSAVVVGGSLIPR